MSASSRTLRTAVITAMALLSVSGWKAEAADKPNIVIILADDLGYTDTGCYGAVKLKTPNIDRLAKEGMRFTDAHAPAAVCSPSRYGLLTGQYPFRNPEFAKQVLPPASPLGIGLDQPTIGTLAKSKGYITGVFGKWHVGIGMSPGADYNGEIKGVPLDVGFDESFIDPCNLASAIFIDGRQVVNADPADPFCWEPKVNGNLVLKGGRKARIATKPAVTGLFTDKAVAFVEQHKDTPFMLLFTPNNVHIAIKPGADFVGKSDCGLYGDYVMELDWMVGEVLAALDRNGLAGKTLVLFTSDNGGAHYKPDVAETYARGHRLNGNLLGQKTDLWEGGHRVPLIVRWPGKVQPEMQSDCQVSLVDVMATMAEVLDAPLAADAGPDSYSFLYALTGATPPSTRRESQVYQGFEKGALAIRQGPWVLIPEQGSDGVTLKGGHGMLSFAELGFVNSDYTAAGKLKPGAPPGQLYDLSSDLSQTKNLYSQSPERVVGLTALLDKIKNEPKSRP